MRETIVDMIDDTNDTNGTNDASILGKIKVIGIGGCGCNALNTVIDSGLEDVEYIAVNTDWQALTLSKASHIIRIGKDTTKGEGAGTDPDLGKMAAMENREEFKEIIDGARMVFLTAGMGGGTGTGAAPVIAEVVREMGIICVAVVTKPFEFEGPRKMKIANKGIETLINNIDSIIVIPNEKLIVDAEERSKNGEEVSLDDSFTLSDQVLMNALKGVVEIVKTIGKRNAEFSDVRTILKNKGRVLMGMGTGKGEDREIDAVKEAIFNPLVESPTIEGATGILVNIVGDNIRTLKFKEGLKLITDLADPDYMLKYGHVHDRSMKDEVRVTVIAAGFDKRMAPKPAGKPLTPGSPGRSGLGTRVSQLPLSFMENSLKGDILNQKRNYKIERESSFDRRKSEGNRIFSMDEKNIFAFIKKSSD